MKLTLEHLAPYLPYGLKGVLTEDKIDDFESEDWVEDLSIFKARAIWKMCGYADGELNIPLGEGEFDGFLWRNGLTYVCFHRGIKPILRPLSDYKDINSQAMSDLNCDLSDQMDLCDLANKHTNIEGIRYRLASICFEHHIDIFGLIEKGLAINMNEL